MGRHAKKVLATMLFKPKPMPEFNLVDFPIIEGLDL